MAKYVRVFERLNHIHALFKGWSFQQDLNIIILIFFLLTEHTAEDVLYLHSITNIFLNITQIVYLKKSVRYFHSYSHYSCLSSISITSTAMHSSI